MHLNLFKNQILNYENVKFLRPHLPTSITEPKYFIVRRLKKNFKELIKKRI